MFEADQAFLYRTLSALTSVGPIEPTHHLVKDLQLDSIDVLDLLESLEKEYGLTIPADVLPRLQTVSDVEAELARLRSSDSR